MSTGAPAAAAAPDIADWPHTEGVPAGRRLLDWAADGERPRLCLLRGPRGSGKSRHLAWFLAGAAGHPRTTAHATVPAAGLVAATLAWELGRQLGYGPLTPERLTEYVAADRRPLLLLLPDLHRAGGGRTDQPAADPSTLVAELVLPLLRLPHVRAVAEVGDTELLSGEDAEVIALDGRVDGRSGPDVQGEAGFEELHDSVPLTPDGRPDWEQAPEAARRHILGRALAEDGGRPRRRVQRLLADPGFLVHGSAAALTPVLADERLRVPPGLRAAWRRAAPQLTASGLGPTERAALLHAAALGADDRLSAYLAPPAGRNHWSAVWAHHGHPVTALARLPGGEGRLLAADGLGGLVTLAAATGAPGVTVPPAASAAASRARSRLRPRGAAPYGEDAVLLLDEGGTLHALSATENGGLGDDGRDGGDGGVGREAKDGGHAADSGGRGSGGNGDGQAALARVAEHHGQAALAAPEFTPTALGGSPCTGHLAVGDRQGAVHLWPPGSSSAEGGRGPRSCRPHDGEVLAVSCLHLPGEGRTLVFSSGPEGTVRLWETSGDPMPAPVEQRPAMATALASADTSAGPLLAVAWGDGVLHLWQPLSGTRRVLPLLHPCDALALTPDGILVAGGPGGTYAVRLDLGSLPQT